MALLERVATLVRANLNDLMDKAEDPEKMIKQVILDMQNQLLQVKTQVAITIADQHVLEKKQQEAEENERAVDAPRRARRGQEGRCPGPRRRGAQHELQSHRRQLPPAGGGSERRRSRT